MTRKTVFYLLIVVLLLFGAFFLENRQENRLNKVVEHNLFEDINGDRIAKIILVKGKDRIELELKDDIWSLPSKRAYPAAFSKVRALLLKILDLSVEQLVTESKSKYKKLGVAEDSTGEGFGKIGFLDSADKPLGEVYIGKERAAKQVSANLMGSSTGQYIRRGNDSKVFLIAEKIQIFTDSINWLDTNIVNVLKRRIASVQQLRSDGTEEYLLEREEGRPKFKLSGNIPKGQKENLPVFSLISALLENVRLTDVFVKEDPEISKVKFETMTKVKLNNSLVYSIQSANRKLEAKEGPQYLLKLSVSRDDEMAREVKSKREQLEQKVEELSNALKEMEAKPAKGSEKKEDGEIQGKREELRKLQIKLSRTPLPAKEDEVSRLNQKYTPWVFVVPEFIGSKFNKRRSDFFEDEAKK